MSNQQRPATITPEELAEQSLRKAGLLQETDKTQAPVAPETSATASEAVAVTVSLSIDDTATADPFAEEPEPEAEERSYSVSLSASSRGTIYYSGVVTIYAPSKERAREIAAEAWGKGNLEVDWDENDSDSDWDMEGFSIDSIDED